MAVATPARANIPAKSPIKKDERVVLFPTAAHLQGDRWVVPLHGWIHEPERGSLWRGALVRGLMKALGIDKAAASSRLFRERVQWFLVDNERGKKVPLTVAGIEVSSNKSGKDGHFRARVSIPRDALASEMAKIDWLSVRARTRPGDHRRFGGHVQLIAPTGLSVISDIDDTLKVSNVSDKKKLLKATFLERFRSVPGMAQVFQALRDQGAVFHYVSASPWHLYVPLSRFLIRAGFPRGTFALREFRVKDRRRWNLLHSPRAHKLAAIRRLVDRYPGRKFVLVGDSSEEDPEIFGEIARSYRKQVARVLIRKVAGTDIDQARMRRAIPAATPFLLFEDPAEIAP